MDSFFFKGGVSLDIWRESRWLLCVIAAGAGFTDLRDGKVYNWWLLWGALAGCWIRGTAFFPGAFLFLVPALVLFRFRMMGAGDGKFMAVIGGWMGIGGGCRTVCLGLMIAVVYSLCRLRRGRGLRARLTYFFAYLMHIFRTKEARAYEDLSLDGQYHKIPLAACLAAGVWAAMLVFGI